MTDILPEKIRPSGNRVLIEEDEKPTMSAGGIHLPTTASDAKFSTFATVVAVGPGKRLDNGTVQEITIKPGDRVVLAKGHGAMVRHERLKLVDFDMIEGVLET